MTLMEIPPNFTFFLSAREIREVTTILSLTTHSLVVFRSHTRLFDKPENGSDVLSVHVLPEEIDPTQTDLKSRGWIVSRLLAKEEQPQSPTKTRICNKCPS